MIPKTTRLSSHDSYTDTGRHFPGAGYPAITCISIAMGPYLQGAPTVFGDTSKSRLRIVFPEPHQNDVLIQLFNSKGELIRKALYNGSDECPCLPLEGQPCGKYSLCICWGGNYIEKEMVLAA